MQCILLAAGYATRLYPLTKDKPKALLEIGDETILDKVIKKAEEIPQINDIYIVTNSKFSDCFKNHKYSARSRITVLDDGTTDNSNRLGAIGDLEFTIEQMNIDDDILVMASDNIFDFSLCDMYSLFKKKDCDTICARVVNSKAELRTMGVLELDGLKVTGFVEKPQEPKTNLGVPPFYMYKRETLPLISEYLKSGNNPDAPGHLVPWLITKKDVYAYVFDGTVTDIGTPESYERVCREAEKNK